MAAEEHCLEVEMAVVAAVPAWPDLAARVARSTSAEREEIHWVVPVEAELVVARLVA